MNTETGNHPRASRNALTGLRVMIIEAGSHRQFGAASDPLTLRLRHDVTWTHHGAMWIRSIALSLIAGLALGTPSVALASPDPVAARIAITKPTPARQAEVSSYAQREAREPMVANYEGGSNPVGEGYTWVIVMSFGLLLALVLVAVETV